LPGTGAHGDLGAEALSFVEFLASCGITLWQTLPLGPTHDDGSPYQCLSLFAGNPNLISLNRLAEHGWLNPEALEGDDHHSPRRRRTLLMQAQQNFFRHAASAEHRAYTAFRAEQAYWLEDYALYRALKRSHAERAWTEWPAMLRDREPEALQQAHSDLEALIERIYFEQFIFSEQWQAVKSAANARGIRLFGDMPIFVAHDSADVWAHRADYDLDERGRPRVVAGVPPDYFSSTGQRWGNPHYRWERIAAAGFRCWIERLQRQLELFDLIRIDHFRGFEAYWEIPADHPTASNGRWVPAPGDALFQALQQHFGALPLVAEDLGLITPEVHALRHKYGLPGMKVLQFAFDGSAKNPYLPHQHETNCVVYTGTHDNDTTLGWFQSLSPEQKRYVDDYLGAPGEPMPWPLIRAALASVAHLAVIPMQDILMLGSEARMNTPGTLSGNWGWRFGWDQVAPDVSERMRHLTQLYNRG
jgi:4-alpha-glucanotransferase